MRVRYLVNNELCCLFNGVMHKIDDIVNLPDELAERYIDYNYVEAFEYPITDNDISCLYKEFMETEDFNRKMDIAIQAYSNSNELNGFLLNSDEVIKFEPVPETRNEWCYYNTQMSNFYISKFIECSFGRLKDDFIRLQSKFPNNTALREIELNKIAKTIKDNNPEGIANWYKAAIYRRIPENPKEEKDFLSRKLDFGLEVYLQGKAIAEYEEFLKAVQPRTIIVKDRSHKSKKFPDYLLFEQKDILAERLKSEFNSDIGKTLRLMLEVLKDKQLLVISEGQKMKIFESLKEYFDRNIGSYNSVFSRDPGKTLLEKSKRASIEARIEFILRSLN
jgi:hypothetical protein